MMDIYNAIFIYFDKVGKAIHHSANEGQIHIGIRSSAVWLQTSLSSHKETKVQFSFTYDGIRLYTDTYCYDSFYTVKDRINSWGHTYLVKKENIIARDLVPCDVYVTIDGVESIYNMGDFILLEGFLCPPTPETQS